MFGHQSIRKITRAQCAERYEKDAPRGKAAGKLV